MSGAPCPGSAACQSLGEMLRGGSYGINPDGWAAFPGDLKLPFGD